MHLKQSLASAAYALPLAFALATSPASAQTLNLKVGECQDRPAVEAALNQDGQKILFVGKRITDNSPVNVFYLNDKGYGYNTEFNKATNEICTRAAYKGAVLNPLENEQIPAWALGIKPNKGIDVQKAYSQKGNDVVRLVFVARSYTKDTKEREIDGKGIVVAAEPLQKGAAVWSVDSDGIPTGLYAMRDFGIVTKNFDAFVARGFSSPLASADNRATTTMVAMRDRAPQRSP